MAYCRSCGVQMSETATICPTCGTAVASTMPVAATAYGPVLVATFNGTSGRLGKTNHLCRWSSESRGARRHQGKDVLAYDAQGQLDWAHDGMRDWLVRLASPPHSVATVAGSQPSCFMPGPPSVMPDTSRSVAGPKIIARAVSIAAALLLVVSWLLHGHGARYYYGPGAMVTLAIALAVALFAGRAAKRG